MLKVKTPMVFFPASNRILKKDLNGKSFLFNSGLAATSLTARGEDMSITTLFISSQAPKIFKFSDSSSLNPRAAAKPRWPLFSSSIKSAP